MTSGDPGSTQSRKLGIKPGQRVCIDHRPAGWDLAPRTSGGGQVDAVETAEIILSFFTSADELAERLPELARRIYPAGALWVAWPRRAGGHRSDITDTVIRDYALPLGIVDVKVAAINEDWSGLRFVWRLRNRGTK